MDERNRFIPDTHELAWAAGFFDGEGNIRAKPQRQWSRTYYYPAMSAPQIDPQVLERFRRAVGGVGKVSGPRDMSCYNPNGQPQWCYEAYSFERVQAVMAMLWKWLSPVKREQARITFLKIKEHPKPKPKPRATCSLDGCDALHLARGRCRNHYNQWYEQRRCR